MPSSPPDRPSHHTRAAAAALVGALALTACAMPRESVDARSGAIDAAADVRETPEAARAVSALLERRDRAVRRDDPEAFARGLGGSRGDRAGQRAWFRNVAQLPLAHFSTSLEPDTLVRDGDGWWGTVRVTTRLRGYDALPVVTRDRFRFVHEDGDLVVASTTDPGWERRHRVARQPWDLGRVVVHEQRGVLGVFSRDSAGAARAGELVGAVADGVAAIGPRVPLPWDGRVVVYALADPAFVAGLEGVPGGDPHAVDGLAFPVLAGPDGAGATEVADTRVLLNPRILDVSAEARDRLVRHELVHVALGERDDRIPVWLSEGLAEYLSVRSLPPSRRLVSGEALAAARRGIDALPEGDTFNGPQAQANYGIAWWICEVVAETWGETMLWTLVEELDDAADPVARLERLLGVGERQLLDDVARTLLATYEP